MLIPSRPGGLGKRLLPPTLATPTPQLPVELWIINIDTQTGKQFIIMDQRLIMVPKQKLTKIDRETASVSNILPDFVRVKSNVSPRPSTFTLSAISNRDTFFIDSPHPARFPLKSMNSAKLKT